MARMFKKYKNKTKNNMPKNLKLFFHINSFEDEKFLMVQLF